MQGKLLWIGFLKYLDVRFALLSSSAKTHIFERKFVSWTTRSGSETRDGTSFLEAFPEPPENDDQTPQHHHHHQEEVEKLWGELPQDPDTEPQQEPRRHRLQEIRQHGGGIRQHQLNRSPENASQDAHDTTDNRLPKVHHAAFLQAQV